MSITRIVTDSTAELPASVVEELEITVVPWTLHMGAETLTDGPQYRTAHYYRETIRRKVMPAAVPPTAATLGSVYGRLCRDTDDIVSIHPSSQLAPVVRAAQQARREFVGRCNIHVVDSRYISRALGQLVIEAAKAAKAGMSGVDVVRYVNGLIPRTYFAFYVDTLDYLARRGLVMDVGVRQGVATFKPLLLIEEGEIVAMQRSRNRGTPVERIYDFVAEFGNIKTLSLLHTGLSRDVEELKEMLATSLPQVDYEEHIYGPVLWSYFGPTALAAVVHEQD
jgi:DegV family protein with EDD domain